MASQEDIELLAQLVGTTNAELKKVDEQIVSSSANLQKSAAQWNPHGIVKSHISKTGEPMAPQAPPSNAYVPPSEEEIQKMIPSSQETVQSVPPPVPSQVQESPDPVNVMSPGIVAQLDRIETKLDTFIAQVDKLTTLDKKLNSFVERGLKDKVKQNIEEK